MFEGYLRKRCKQQRNYTPILGFAHEMMFISTDTTLSVSKRAQKKLGAAKSQEKMSTLGAISQFIEKVISTPFSPLLPYPPPPHEVCLVPVYGNMQI